MISRPSSLRKAEADGQPRVLDVGAHVGGFGVAAARAGAQVVALDRSAPALEHVRRNAALNGVEGQVTTVRADMFEPLEDPGVIRAGRFGWKAQVATVLSFSGDAALNEMGLTNRLMAEENAPGGDAALLLQCDGRQDPEDGPDAEGRHFIDRVTDFQRFLAPRLRRREVG